MRIIKLLIIFALLANACSKEKDTIYLNSPYPQPEDTNQVVNDTNGNNGGNNGGNGGGADSCSFSTDDWSSFDYDIVEAKVLDNGKLIFITSNPSQIVKYDPNTGEEYTLSLNKTPTCIDIALDQERALVGHDALLSLIDLSNLTLIKNVSVSCDAYDVVLGPNNWAYAFPAGGQHTTIKCVDLDTEIEINSIGGSVRETTKGAMHPSFESIYAADNGLSPSDLEKFDIAHDTAIRLYDSPYHGDYPFEGELWISADGDHIFSRGKTIVKATSDPNTDLTYAGSLESEYNTIIQLHEHAASNRLAVMYNTYTWYWEIWPHDQVYIYDATFYDLKQKIDIPQLSSNGACFNMETKFIFFANDGLSLHLIGEAVSIDDETDRTWCHLELDI